MLTPLPSLLPEASKVSSSAEVKEIRRFCARISSFFKIDDFWWCVIVWECVYSTGHCLNSLCSVSHSQASTRIPNPYHTVTAYDRVTSRYLY